MWWIVGDGGFDVLDATDDARGVAGALPMLKINGAGRPGRGTMASSSHVIACNSANAAAEAAVAAAAAEAAAAALSSAARRREDDDVDASDMTRDRSKDKSSATAATIAKPGDPVDSVLNVESVEVIVAAGPGSSAVWYSAVDDQDLEKVCGASLVPNQHEGRGLCRRKHGAAVVGEVKGMPTWTTARFAWTLL